MYICCHSEIKPLTVNISSGKERIGIPEMEKKSLALLILLAGVICISAQEEDRCANYDDSLCAGLTNGRFAPSTQSCQQWIQCHEERVIGCGFCQNGFYFDDTRGGCAPQEEVECTIGLDQCTPGLINRVPREDSCTTYYQCVGSGDPIEHQCGEGLQFDEVEEKCNFRDLVRCLREPYPFECPATDAPFTQEAHPWVCEKFFMCIAGVAHENTCPEGQVFDVNIGWCNAEGVAECGVLPPGSGSANVQAFDDQEITCSEKPTYYIQSHPSNPTKYVQCIFGDANIMACVPGTVFDPEGLRCIIA